MSTQNPAHRISRWSVAGMEGMWAKMFDPPTTSPPTPELLAPTNPVPEVMAAAGLQNPPAVPNTVQRDLLHGMKMPTWDGLKQLLFFTFRDADNPATDGGNYPGATIRVPRGVVYHCATSGKGPPPHTIHWHGIEPTPMNDGVGHCSMELGQYTYQWQANFIGTYFYHCHRNTMQHFEFGLFGLLIIEPPDAYFATQKDPSIPVGHCRDGKRRTAASLASFPQFPGFNPNRISESDPLGEYLTDPHAMTVPYDVEALWVLDDRDSVWSDLAPDARATYPKYGAIPGYNDDFARRAGINGFFAFNDFNADYWFVTGEPVPVTRGGIGSIPSGLVIPPELNSGVSGTQISIEAKVGDTILVRCLNGAYNSIEVTFPLDVVIIAWDGRALGVPPYGFNEAYLLPAGTPLRTSTARRFDALMRPTSPFDGFATVKFINTRGEGIEGWEEVLAAAAIPVRIAENPALPAFTLSGKIVDQAGQPLPGALLDAFPAETGTSAPVTVATEGSGSYSITGLLAGTYTLSPRMKDAVFLPQSRRVTVSDSEQSGVDFTAFTSSGPLGVRLLADAASPQPAGGEITFNALGYGGGGGYAYEFRLNGRRVQDYSPVNAWLWNTADLPAGTYRVQVTVRGAGGKQTVKTVLEYSLNSTPATGGTVTANLPAPQPPGTLVTFTAAGSGGSGYYQYEFRLVSGARQKRLRGYSSNPSFTWKAGPPGSYFIQANIRGAGSKSKTPDAQHAIPFTVLGV